MFFASDNAGIVHPKVMDALQKANTGYASPYGADPAMITVVQQIRDLFEAPQAAVYLVATGTAANSIILGTLAQPWETVFCADHAHIQVDECNAPEFYIGGGKLTLIDSADGKFTATDLRDTILGEETRGVHGPQRGPVSITQLTELGTAYQLDEIKDICAVAKAFDLPVHLDGARFANALTALGCTPAEMTWKAGVDAVSFGGTKNGLMGVEAVIFFDPKHAWEFELRRKRGAHLFSKHRYLSTQMETYLTDDLWLETAKSANDAARYFADELAKSDSVEFDHPVDGNMIFAKFPRAAHQRLQDAGAVYYVWEGALEGDNPDALLTARLVCDWNTSKDAIDAFVAHI